MCLSYNFRSMKVYTQLKLKTALYRDYDFYSRITIKIKLHLLIIVLR